MYRLNFGNGQIHGNFSSFEKAYEAYKKFHDAYTTIQQYEFGNAECEGIWHKVEQFRMDKASKNEW